MIMLPWPPAKLSPNARTHWAVKAKAFRTYKVQCHALLAQHREALRGRDTYALEFRPPDNRRRDLDNALSSAKALIDALALVSGVDDSRFRLTIQKGEPTKGGAVVVA